MIIAMRTLANDRRLSRFAVSTPDARATVAAGLVALVTACATLPSVIETPDVFVPAATQTVQWDVARRNLAQALLRAAYIVSYTGPTMHSSRPPRHVSVTPAYVAFRDTVVATFNPALVNYERGQTGLDTTSKPYVRRVLRFAPGDVLIAKASGGWSAGVPNQGSGGSPQPGAKENYLHFVFSERADAEAFLQAWHDARLAAHGAGDGDRDFAERAALWRLRTAKPPLSEAANRHRVVAEGATRARDYARAIEEFEAALETDPMWPSGNFNLALLYEATEEWDEAVRYMRRFLLLEPDSREATAARDKIILWEDRARRELR